MSCKGNEPTFLFSIAESYWLSINVMKIKKFFLILQKNFNEDPGNSLH